MTLENIELFSGLPEAQLLRLAEQARQRTYPAGTVIVNEGDEAHGMFIINSGALKVFVTEENGKEVTLSLLGEDDYFGELALVDDAPRSASVMTLERSTLMQISRNDFNDVIATNPACLQIILRNLVGRIRELTDNVRALALIDVFGRISRIFDSMAEPEGELRIIRRRMTQQDLANLVGASREMVNRILRELVAGDYIEIHHQYILLKRKLPARW
ncbi:Crp/Fnr family transcriptional regulator [Nitrogeniibacter mangrovi]|uniref:Crp/Fnr family transcriptional regulator n=1 Tax=Nitrogeniibacter mangrovi TaxID=2016596 RepID=A0A6C1B3D9_9RHOO|nr:Crp/Fnr family transcriptional regulator [Nitrogeniibacter mangrovi]QID17499.1 Crp/Fnr family transcriptional regulator [Nitrogeniibacter mangrovi]